MPRRGSFFHAGVPQLRNNKQASGASLHLHLDLTRPKTLHADCNIEPVRCLAPGYSRLSCCNRTGQPSSAGPDISLLRPELQRQWHHAKNPLLGDRQITASSGLRVWWSCDQCPCGLPHEWLATVSNRQDIDTQCPFCTNNRLCQHNSLLTMAQAVAAYWDTAKNGRTPGQVTACSSTRIGFAQRVVTAGKPRYMSKLTARVVVLSAQR